MIIYKIKGHCCEVWTQEETAMAKFTPSPASGAYNVEHLLHLCRLASENSINFYMYREHPIQVSLGKVLS